MITMNKLLKLLFIGLLSLVNVFTYSQDFPEKPNPPKIVNDFAGFLSSPGTTSFRKQASSI
jgi:hypothetical protein